MNLLPCVCCNGTRPPGKHYLCRQTRFSELPQETPRHYARLPPQEMPRRAPFCHTCRPGGPGWRGMWALWPGGRGPNSATCTLRGLAPGSSSVKQRLWSLSLPFSACVRFGVSPSLPAPGKQSSVSPYGTCHSPGAAELQPTGPSLKGVKGWELWREQLLLRGRCSGRMPRTTQTPGILFALTAAEDRITEKY